MNSKRTYPRTLDPEVNVKLKHILLASLFRRGRLVRSLLAGASAVIRSGRLPLIGKLNPFTKTRSNRMVSLPVNKTLAADPDFPLPPMVVTELINRSKYHSIFNFCVCRHGRNCSSHSHDIGCLFLGEGGLDIIPQLARRVTADEAHAHLARAVEEGLVPMTTRLRADHYAFLTPDRHRFLAVCFCCNCCCLMSNYRFVPPARLAQIYPRLEGLKIKVDADLCVGCGLCVQTCYMQAISVEDGRARISEICRGCGRCVTACPQDAISMSLTDPDYVDKTVSEFLSFVKLD